MPRKKTQQKICRVESCENPVKAKGICMSCYGKLYRKLQGTCKIDGCTRKACAKGMCSRHLQQSYRAGGAKVTRDGNQNRPDPTAALNHPAFLYFLYKFPRCDPASYGLKSRRDIPLWKKNLGKEKETAPKKDIWFEPK